MGKSQARSRYEDKQFPPFAAGFAGILVPAQHFDIVNGFFNRCRDGAILVGFGQQRSGHRINKAEKEIIRIIAIQSDGSSEPSGWSLVVRTLKREVRAFGGCLGMQRR
jgi:hypothetical protein